MQLAANPSYWSTSDNVKRSFIPQQQYDEAPDVSISDYYPDLSASDVDAAYVDEDDYANYNTNDANAYFNRINQDNINEFYREINELLSRKPNNRK